MTDVGQDSSMEDILASIKRVIAEDPKPQPARGRAAFVEPRADMDDADDDVLELDQPVQIAPAAPPLADTSLVSANAAEASRNSLAALTALRSPGPAPVADAGPLEGVIRDMLRPMLKEWLDQRLPEIVQEIVAKEVARITGKG